MSEIRRQTAYKCSIKQILDGRYIQQQGLSPNYIELDGLKVARTNTLSILISKEGNTLRVDDGTGQIHVMLFEEHLKKRVPKLGKLIKIIGKPREYNGKRFIVPEIIKEITNYKWMDVRQIELKALYSNKKEIKKEENTKNNKQKMDMPEVIENYQEKILSEIKKLDKGDGAPYNELINNLNMKDAQEKIEELIKEGEIFEIRGKIKIL